MFTFSTDQTDDGIRKLFPTTFLMTGCHMSTNGQRSIQEQDALFCPSGQIARLWNRFAKVCLNLLKNIAQRRRKWHAIVDRKAQAMRLLRLVIRVLSDEHHLYFGQRTEIKSIEDECARGIASSLCILRLYKLNQLFKIGFVELWLEFFKPRCFYLYLSHSL